MLVPHPRPQVFNPMPSRSWLLMLAVLLLLALLPHTPLPVALPPAAPPASAPVAAPEFGNLPVLFVANQGQTDDQVDYYVQGQDKTLFFTSEGVTIALHGDQPAPPASRDRLMSSAGNAAPASAIGPTLPSRWVVKLDFVGARQDVQPVGEARAETIISFFTGQPDQWQTAISTFQRLVYPELWPGIDLVYTGTADRLKYEFVVQPGADPSQIQLAYQGASGVTVNAAGQLEVTTGLGRFSDDTPVSYQEIDGIRQTVATRYALGTPAADGSVRYGFALGDYDPQQPLIIDPAVLLYAGYIGGSGYDIGSDIAVDGDGNTYVTGNTRSTADSFPVTVGPSLMPNGDGRDDSYTFVAKVSADGTRLLYAGYIGGSDDYGTGIAVDDGGNAYVTGVTQTSEAVFPVTVGPDLTYNGLSDAFVAKISADGTRLLYAGYIGGSDYDTGFDIGLDGDGNAYVTGVTRSSEASFPVMSGPDLIHNGENDAFVAKVNAAGTGLDYAGYVGGSGIEEGYGIAVDGDGNAYVTGKTFSSEASFTVVGGPDLAYSGDGDAFVAKVNPEGTNLLYAGYIGGDSFEEGMDVAVDSVGNAYIVGSTESTEGSFLALGGPDLTHNGDSDAFVAKVQADGTRLTYAGYIGGNSFEEGTGIAVDEAGNAYVVGSTRSTEASFPALGGPDLTHNGDIDAFVTKVGADGTSLLYAGYIGGSGNDGSFGIAVDSAGNAYVTGYTASTEASFPVMGGPDLTYNDGNEERPFGGRGDAFVAKIGVFEETPAPLSTYVPLLRR